MTGGFGLAKSAAILLAGAILAFPPSSPPLVRGQSVSTLAVQTKKCSKGHLNAASRSYCKVCGTKLAAAKPKQESTQKPVEKPKPKLGSHPSIPTIGRVQWFDGVGGGGEVQSSKIGRLFRIMLEFGHTGQLKEVTVEIPQIGRRWDVTERSHLDVDISDCWTSGKLTLKVRVVDAKGATTKWVSGFVDEQLDEPDVKFLVQGTSICPTIMKWRKRAQWLRWKGPSVIRDLRGVLDPPTHVPIADLNATWYGAWNLDGANLYVEAFFDSTDELVYMFVAGSPFTFKLFGRGLEGGAKFESAFQLPSTSWSIRDGWATYDRGKMANENSGRILAVSQDGQSLHGIGFKCK